MRCRLTLAVVVAFIGSSSVPALTQAPPPQHWRPPPLTEEEPGWLELVLDRQLELRQGKYRWLSEGAILALELAVLAEELVMRLGA